MNSRLLNPATVPAVRGVVLGAALLAVLAVAPVAVAARIEAPKLLPRNTYLYAQVANVPELVEAFHATNLGRMIADPQIKPFVEKLYTAANDALVQVQERTGLSIDELAQIPQGEITLAAMPVEGNQFAMIFLVDCGDAQTAKRFVEKIRDMLEQAGGLPLEENADGVTLHITEPVGPMQFVFFEHDATVAITGGVDTAKQLLARWNEGADDCLADNPRFRAMMDRCRGTKDESPHFVFFVDPMEYMWEVSKLNPAMQVGLRMLPALGLDGLKCIGGSMVLATEDFDMIIHLHVLLDSPRAGVLELVTLDSGDDTPPHWVPDDVAQYSSWHADVAKAFRKGTKLADTFRFREEGATAGRLNDRVRDAIGVDLSNDLLPAITGRAIHVTWFPQTAQVGIGAANLFGVELGDSQAFSNTLDKAVAHFGERFEKQAFAGMVYYRQSAQREPDDPQPVFCFTQLDDWLLLADRPSVMEHILKQRDERSNRLVDALDFKLIVSKIARQPGGERPAMMGFQRPDAGFKYMYDLALAESTKQRLRERADNNPFFKALDAGLNNNPLPPWTALSRYLAPEGTMLVNDDSGIHYMRFSLRRK